MSSSLHIFKHILTTLPFSLSCYETLNLLCSQALQVHRSHHRWSSFELTQGILMKEKLSTSFLTPLFGSPTPNTSSISPWTMMTIKQVAEIVQKLSIDTTTYPPMYIKQEKFRTHYLSYSYNIWIMKPYFWPTFQQPKFAGTIFA